MQMRNYFLRLFNKALSLKKHLNQRKPRKKGLDSAARYGWAFDEVAASSNNDKDKIINRLVFI